MSMENPTPRRFAAIELRVTEVVLVTKTIGMPASRSRCKASPTPGSGFHETVSTPSMSTSSPRPCMRDNDTSTQWETGTPSGSFIVWKQSQEDSDDSTGLGLSRSAASSATVELPLPGTPVTRTTRGGVAPALSPMSVGNPDVPQQGTGQLAHLRVRKVSWRKPRDLGRFVPVGRWSSRLHDGVEDHDDIGGLIAVRIGHPVVGAAQHSQRRAKPNRDSGLLLGLSARGLLR